MNYISNLFVVFNYSVLNKTDINDKVEKKGGHDRRLNSGHIKGHILFFLSSIPSFNLIISAQADMRSSDTDWFKVREKDKIALVL